MVFDVTYIWIYPRIFIHPRDRDRARESGTVSLPTCYHIPLIQP